MDRTGRRAAVATSEARLAKNAATRQDAVVGIARRCIVVLEACIRLAEKPRIPRRVIAARLRRMAREIVRVPELNQATKRIVLERTIRLVRQLER
jgi:hypothetical protein